jgi:hypothetical protein
LPGEYVLFEPIARSPAQQISHLHSNRISLPLTQSLRILLSGIFAIQLVVNETVDALEITSATCCFGRV